MKIIHVISVAAALGLCVNGPSYAQATAAGAAASGVCQKLSGDYESLSKDLAVLEADGLTDNSAPRSQVRATRENTAFQKAALLVTFMQSAKCSLPAKLPDGMLYVTPALECQAARLRYSNDYGTAKQEQSKADSEAKCDRSKWEAMKLN